MAKFFYRMQNILDIKYKLEDQAKQEYQEVRVKLNQALDDLQYMISRKEGYVLEFIELTSSVLDIIEITNCRNAIILMEEQIRLQEAKIVQIENELELARIKLNQVVQERKIHEKLKEKQFEDFLQEINNQEKKEIDELISYQYNKNGDNLED